MPKSANCLPTMYWVRSKPLSQIIYFEVLHNYLYVLTNSLWSDILLTHIFANVRFYSFYETFMFHMVLINCQLFIIHCDLVTPISWPILVQVMFCLLTLQSYHLTRCWLHMNESMGIIYSGISINTIFLFRKCIGRRRLQMSAVLFKPQFVMRDAVFAAAQHLLPRPPMLAYFLWQWCFETQCYSGFYLRKEFIMIVINILMQEFAQRCAIIYKVWQTRTVCILLGTYCLGLLPDTSNRGLRMRREWRERFPHHRELAIPT